VSFNPKRRNAKIKTIGEITMKNLGSLKITTVGDRELA